MRMNTDIPRILSLVAIATIAASRTAGAQGASVFVEGEYGTRFNDAVYGLNTADHHMSTILLNADGSWSHGESGFFVREFGGHFVNGAGALTGSETAVYVEWTTRAFLWRSNSDCRWCVRDAFVAGQVVRGTGTHTNLVGGGIKIHLGAMSTTNTLYLRRNEGEHASAKWRTSWGMPFAVRSVAMSFEGSADVVRPTSAGTDVCIMPAALADASRLIGARAGTVSLGSEWFYHHAIGARLSSPELIARWSF